MPLVGNVIQVDIGQRTQLAGSDTTVYVTDSTGTVLDSTIVYKPGSVINLVADTLVTGGVPKCVSRCPGLNDAGVPFAYTDNGVRNSFSYVYAVTCVLPSIDFDSCVRLPNAS